MDYFKSRQNLRGIVLALGIACTASNAFAVSLATPPENAGANTAMAVQQKITVTGNVSDATGPLVGATIKVKGTSNGVVADMDGNFKISAGPNDVLEVSYIGYVTQNVKINNRSNLKIVLEEEKHSLNEVVVIGYGTQRREAVTGSVANVSGDELNQIAATNAAQALQGRELINVIRARAGKWSFSNAKNDYYVADFSKEMTDATPQKITIDYILEELSREYFGEGHRWFDLVRTQMWEELAKEYTIAGMNATDVTPQKYTRTITKQHYLRPIPQGQLDAMEMTDEEKAEFQNPGY